MSAPPLPVVRAPAKLNLTLAVLGRRPDGFHELSTAMVALARHDRLRVLPRGDAPLVLSGPQASTDVPAGRDNLAWRAFAEVLVLGGGDPERWSLALEKELPSGAGLGGGSADAAAGALAAMRLVGLGPAHEAAVLERLAALGSDCPFFLAARGGLARCTGRGERVEALGPPRSPRAFLVLTPSVRCATAAVYRALADAPPAARRSPAPAAVRAAFFEAPLEEARAALANDLEPAALASHPALGEVRAWLDARGASHFRLAGSGSSFFGLFAGEREARAELERLAEGPDATRPGLRAAFVSRAAGAGVTLESTR